ncbi:MAG: type II CAAX endopeptidase family protein [Anaerolineales bacterium]
MKAPNSDNVQRVWLYFAVTYAFSWVFWIPNALLAHGVDLPPALKDFLQGPLNPAAFGPLIAAFLLTFADEGIPGAIQLLKCGFDLGFNKIWLAAVLFVPLAVFGGSVGAAILAGVRPFDTSVIANPPYALIAFFVILLTSGPLQEEFGWRGYALPRLQSRFSPLVSGLVVGFFWWLWHLPAVFIPGRFMTDHLVVFLALLVVITLTSILFTWVYNHTNGSILAAMLMHTAMNWSIWITMPDMKMDLPTAAFMVVFLLAAVWVVLRSWGAAWVRPVR